MTPQPQPKRAYGISARQVSLLGNIKKWSKSVDCIFNVAFTFPIAFSGFLS